VVRSSPAANVASFVAWHVAAIMRQVLSYIRISTGKLGKSGLDAIARFAAAEGCEVVGEFVEATTPTLWATGQSWPRF
jgi:hypothetical protein